MKGKYRTAISTIGVAAVVATALALLPAHHRPAHTQGATGPIAPAPFQQVRVYRTPGGGLLRTETVRWQGPGSMTIVTWSSNGKAGAALPPWVGVELENMAAQQRLLQAAMQRLMSAQAPLLPFAGPMGPLPSLSIQVEWPQGIRAPAPAIAPATVPATTPTAAPAQAPAPVLHPQARQTVDI